MKVHSDGANRTRVEMADGSTVFVSYSTAVAVRMPNGARYRTDARHSNTTQKHLTQWEMKTAEQKPQAFFDNLYRGV